jgi:hypothetical protein
VSAPLISYFKVKDGKATAYDDRRRETTSVPIHEPPIVRLGFDRL